MAAILQVKFLTIIWTNDGQVYWHIHDLYASLGINELITVIGPGGSECYRNNIY